MRRLAILAASAVFVVSSAQSALATGISFTGSSGSLAASANFNISGGDLIITLTNTALTSPNDPASVLSGLYFSLTGAPTLTTVSALLGTGSTIANASACDVNPCTPATTNVGGEFSYAQGGAGILPGTNEGIASSGYLNANTSAGNFNGPDLQSPAALDGIEFGIVPTSYVDGSGNGGVHNQAFVRDTVVFTLSGIGNLTLSDIGHVFFTYGTALGGDEPHFPGGGGGSNGQTPVPEPASLALFGTGLALAANKLRRKRA